ncbi:response regulator [Brevundimonas sp. 2R-24]|uniref:Response regulator n=1 Tax=Peiella sedimenti TaxID=3061083 RepID=A0ABT8SLT3_9CAUL|nr:response regulator [Caulobacteraceae bacterium XZ-24]
MRDAVHAQIVLVDDDPAVTRAIEFSFGLEGLTVWSYADGAGALSSDRLDDAGCLVLDYQLPDMDGLELLRRLRVQGVSAPAILITSNPKRDMRRRAEAAGAPIVEKPLLSDALLESVREALAEAA